MSADGDAWEAREREMGTSAAATADSSAARTTSGCETMHT
jgi:hypothetical protein